MVVNYSCNRTCAASEPVFINIFVQPQIFSAIGTADKCAAPLICTDTEIWLTNGRQNFCTKYLCITVIVLHVIIVSTISLDKFMLHLCTNAYLKKKFVPYFH